jgi:tetratricopeptide (TPR) repeat protein
LSAWSQQDLKTALKLSNSEQYEEAEKVFDDLIKQSPANGDIYYYYGRTVIKDYLADTFSNSMTEFANRAEALFQSGIQKAPANMLNYVGMGAVTLMKTSDTTKAKPYFDKAEAAVPLTLKKKQYTPQMAIILTEIAASQLYGKVNNTDKAIKLLNRAKIINPADPEIYNTMGDVYIKRNDASNGLSNYNQALAKDPTSPLPKIKIGNIYMRVPNLNAARPYFEEALQIDSTFAPVYRSLGELYTKAGRYDLAKQNYLKFLQLSGNNAPAKVRYANSLFQTKDYAGALGVIEEVLQVDNSRNYLNRLAAYCCYEKKPQELEKGKTFIETFLKNASETSIFYKDYAYYGKILFKLANGDSAKLNQAFVQYEKALAMDDTDVPLISEMATNYYYSQRYQRAIDMYLLKAEKGKAGENDAMQIGKAYYQLSNTAKANEVFSKIISEQPNNLEARVYLARTYSKMDPTNELGTAEPKFNDVITTIGTDTEKNKNYLYEAYSYMSSLYLTRKDYSVAKQWNEKIINLDPNNKEWKLKALNSNVIMYYREKNYIESRNIYNRILELEPNNASAKQAVIDLTKIINMERNMR